MTEEPKATAAPPSTGEAPAGTEHDPSVRIYERKRKSNDVMFSRDTVVNDVAAAGGVPRRIMVRSSTLEVRRRDSLAHAKAAPRRTFSFHGFTGVVGNIAGAADKLVAGTGSFVQGLFFKRYDVEGEPEEVVCEGDCKPTGPKLKPHVVRSIGRRWTSKADSSWQVSIAACNDPQFAWESKKGRTMTQVLDVCSAHFAPS